MFPWEFLITIKAVRNTAFLTANLLAEPAGRHREDERAGVSQHIYVESPMTRREAKKAGRKGSSLC